MEVLTREAPAGRTPLEEFLRDFMETAGGAWEEIEPQVYDVLWPSAAAGATPDEAAPGLLRVAFDPEAIPEHPGAQLASFGTPLVDRLLRAAVGRGRYAEAYLNGLNLAPHDLPGRVRRVIRLPDGVDLSLQRVRPLYFAQAVFWFEATFLSDQKEQEIVSIAFDLCSGRQVRHLERLLDFERLAEEPAQYLAEARRASVAAVYPRAREQVLRTVASLANQHRRELQDRVQRQIERMRDYYGDLRSELAEQIRRAQRRGDDAAKLLPRREAIDREERLRVTELCEKSAMRVRLRLASLLLVRQPKLLLRSAAACPRRPGAAAELDLVWDPLTESLEAAACPQCGAPTYVFQLNRLTRLACPACAGAPPKG